MGRPRKHASQNLPKYVRLKGKRYYLEPKGDLKNALESKSSIALGGSYVEMLGNYHSLVSKIETDRQRSANIKDMGDLIDEFMLGERPKQVSRREISQSTYTAEKSKCKPLRRSFAHFHPSEIRKVDLYEYIDLRIEEGVSTSINRELSLLGRIFQYGERLGLIEQSPCTNIKRVKESGRTRYISDQEYMSFREFVTQKKNPQVAAYMDFKYVTGLRTGDILRLRLSDAKDDGLHIYVSKNNQSRIMQWTPTLRTVFKALQLSSAQRWKAKNRSKIGPSSIYLVHNLDGQPFTPSGWRANFYKLMKAAVKKGRLEEPFCDHDIRAKAGSDAESVEVAQKFLVHLNIRTTQKHYRRKPELIQPLL